MKEDFVNITEYFNDRGICVKRTANGIDLPADTEPSVVYFNIPDIAWAKQIRFMTKNQFDEKYPSAN